MPLPTTTGDTVSASERLLTILRIPLIARITDFFSLDFIYQFWFVNGHAAMPAPISIQTHFM